MHHPSDRIAHTTAFVTPFVGGRERLSRMGLIVICYSCKLSSYRGCYNYISKAMTFLKVVNVYKGNNVDKSMKNIARLISK